MEGETDKKHPVKFDYGKWFFGWIWGPGEWSWFYPFVWSEKDFRFFGHREDWYDGPMHFFGLWFVNIQWRR